MELEDLEAKIKELEDKKSKLIAEIKKNYGRIRYKKYEEKALEPFLKETENIQIEPVRRKLRSLEFKISTQAYTSQLEKQMIKEVKKVEAELGKMRLVEKARRKKRLVTQDILDCEKRIAEIEEELKVMRAELRELYGKFKSLKGSSNKREGSRGLVFGEKPEDMVSMEDIVIIEDNRKKD